MKLYAYSVETMEVLGVVEGDTNEECETKMAERGYEGDDIGWTYTPAFGFEGGLKYAKI